MVNGSSNFHSTSLVIYHYKNSLPITTAKFSREVSYYPNLDLAFILKPGPLEAELCLGRPGSHAHLQIQVGQQPHGLAWVPLKEAG